MDRLVVINPLTNKQAVVIKVMRSGEKPEPYGVLKPGSSMDVYLAEGRQIVLEEKKDG